MKVLWLSSWYPNPVDPYDGDFIQRHAKALAAYIPVTVFYIAQSGESMNIDKDSVIEHEENNVKEKIIFFRFKKTGLKWIDKFIYNIRYYRTYKKAIINYIGNQGRPDIVHVHVPMKAGMIAMWIQRRWKIPYIVSEQSSMYNKTATDNFFKKNFLHRYNVKKIFRNATAVTNVSYTVGEKLKVLFDLLSVKVIHNTVNIHFFNYKETPFPKFRFIHVSTLTHQKNVEGILRAICHLTEFHKNFELVIVGPMKPELEKMTEELGLQSVVSFTGVITYPEVAFQMKKASAFVMFSRHENFPCVMIEALCCGLPFIGTDVGGMAEAIDKSNGMIVPSEDEKQLFLSMSRMINEYQKFNREKIAYEAQQKYSYSSIGKQFVELYSKILKE